MLRRGSSARMPDYALGLAWSSDDAMLAAGSTTRRDLDLEGRGCHGAGLEDPSGGRTVGTETAFRVSRFCPGERVLASCGRDGTLRLWDVRSGAALARTLPVGGYLDDLAHSEDGSMITAVGTDGYLRVWGSDGLVPSLAVPLHQGPVAAVAWNGDHIFTASEDGRSVSSIWTKQNGNRVLARSSALRSPTIPK